MRRKNLALVCIVLMGMVLFPALAATFVDNSSATFGLGNYGLYTQWNTNRVELNGAGRTNLSGTYASNVKDATGPATWNTIAWTESIPYKEELPNSKGSDSGANMASNVLLFHMNEASGTINDASGTGNNGTTFGGITYQAGGATGGRYNQALGFDGTNDYVSVANAASLNITGDITVEAWIRPAVTINSSNYSYRILEKALRYYLVFISPNFNCPTAGQIAFDINNGTAGGDNVACSTTSTWNANTWYHVVGTWSGVNPNRFIRMYVNGVQERAVVYNGAIGSTDTSALLLGRRLSSPSYWWNGRMDEVAIYNTALGATEILNHYKRGILNLRLQARSCDDAACVGESWSSYYTTPGPNALSQPNNRYFQYQAFFETENSTYTGEMQSVSIDYNLAETSPTLSVGPLTSCPNQMTLTWQGAQPPVGKTISSYNIYRSTTSPVNTSGAAYANTPSSPYTDTSVSSSSGVTYYYKVRAVYNNSTLGPESNEASGTTLDCVGTAPVLTAADSTGCPNSIVLTWTAATPPYGRTITGYNVYRSTTSPVPTTTPYVSLGNVLTYTDTGVSTSAMTYYYLVRAVFSDATYLNSNEDYAATVQCTFPLTTSVVGNGSVTSNPAGIDCGSDCMEIYNYGTIVTLTATPDGTSQFVGWSGDCSGTSLTCTLTIDAAKNVTATFGLKQGKKVQLPSMLPVVRNNLTKAHNLLTQANELLSQAKSKNLDTSACEKLISEASELIEKSMKHLTNPIYANNLALQASEKLKQAIDCLKALAG
jgi:hypothetical protein